MWSEPYFGVTHLGAGSEERWATVEMHGTVHVLTRWERGRLFGSQQEDFDDIAAAKAAGERWYRGA